MKRNFCIAVMTIFGLVCWASVDKARKESNPEYIKQERQAREERQALEEQQRKQKQQTEDEAKAKSAKEENKAEALYAARDLVLSRLKAPSTATFGESSVIDRGNDVYIVTSYVDSQNSFGAMLRNRYTCRLKLTPDGQHWQVLQFSFGQ